jgi:chorismate mutase
MIPELVKLANKADEHGHTDIADKIDELARHLLFAEQRNQNWKKIGGLKYYFQTLEDEDRAQELWDELRSRSAKRAPYLELEKYGGWWQNQWQNFKSNIDPTQIDKAVEQIRASIPQYLQAGDAGVKQLNDKLIQLGQIAQQMKNNRSYPIYAIRGQAIMKCMLTWMKDTRQDYQQLDGYLSKWKMFMPSNEEMAKGQMGYGMGEENQQQQVLPAQAAKFVRSNPDYYLGFLKQWATTNQPIVVRAFNLGNPQPPDFTQWLDDAVHNPQTAPKLATLWINSFPPAKVSYMQWLSTQQMGLGLPPEAAPTT